jgi:hypothetical protein
MEYHLISLSDDEAKNDRIEDTFDRRLRRSINDKIRVAGLLLRNEQPASTELLDWLETWTMAFREAGGRLIVIPATADQFEALDLSHPAQLLSYFSSLDEWEAAYPVQQQVQEMVTTPQPIVPVIAVRAQEAPRIEQSVSRPESSVSQPEAASVLEPEILPVFPVVEVGSMVEISGEYACEGCGMQRTWLKGDCIEACENVECLNSKAGWKLLCDLF